MLTEESAGTPGLYALSVRDIIPEINAAIIISPMIERRIISPLRSEPVDSINLKRDKIIEKHHEYEYRCNKADCEKAWYKEPRTNSSVIIQLVFQQGFWRYPSHIYT